jgi:hypothetical protein
MIPKSLKEIRLIEWKGYYAHILFIVIAILFVGRGIDFGFMSHFFNGGDSFQFLNFDLFIQKGFFIWEPTSTGKILPMAFYFVPYNLILKVAYLITHQIILSVNIFWILSIYFIQLSFFLFFNIFLDRWRSIVSVLLIIFNVYFLILFHTPLNINAVAFLAFPLMYYLFNAYFRKRSFIYAFFYIIFQIILYRNFNILIIANVLVPLLFFLLNYDLLKKKRAEYIKKTVIVWAGGALVTSMLTVSLFFYYSSDLSKDNKNVDQYNESALGIHDVFKLSNLYRFETNYGFLYMGGREITGAQGKDISEMYINNPFFIAVSFIPFLLFFWSIFLKVTSDDPKKKRENLVLLFFIVILLFFAKSMNPPFQGIAEYLYDNRVFTLFFRSGSKYFLMFILPLMILYMMGSRKKTIINVAILVFILTNFLLFFVYTKPIHESWNSVLPDGYMDFVAGIGKEKDINRFLILPISDHLAGYTSYKDGFTGPDRLETLSGKTFLDKIYSVVISDQYIDVMDRIRKNYLLANEYPNILGYEYIIIEKDAISSSFYKVDNYHNILQVLDNKKWDKIFENDKFILFKLKDNSFFGRIYSSKSKVEFRRISNAEYNIGLNIKEKDRLYFQESFDPGWILYLRPIANDDWCMPISYYDKTMTTECEHNQGLAYPGNFSCLVSKSIFDDSHQIENKYANAWTIDPEYIKQNFSKEYYEENPDGSIDVEMVLYFKPQSYFYLGLIVSGLTLVGLIGYLGYDIRKRKQSKSSKKDEADI